MIVNDSLRVREERKKKKRCTHFRYELFRSDVHSEETSPTNLDPTRDEELGDVSPSVPALFISILRRS